MRFVDEHDITSAPADPGCFTAGVQTSTILPALQPSGMRANRFVYEPGARSHWHTHDGEQAIYVLAGRGVVHRAGEESGTVVGPGSWVHVEAGEMHWHGAMDDDVFVHLAITASEATNWFDPVDAEQ